MKRKNSVLAILLAIAMVLQGISPAVVHAEGEEPWSTESVEGQLTVTYTDGVDGEVIFEDLFLKVQYGDQTPDASNYLYPYRYGYDFIGWEPEPAEYVTENAVYTAAWRMHDRNENGIMDEEEALTVTLVYGQGSTLDGREIEEYSVRWNENGQALFPGDSISVSAYYFHPEREGYILAGWNPIIPQTILEDGTYTAIWKADANHNGTADEDEQHYSATYTDGVDDEVIFEDYVFSDLVAGTEMPHYPHPNLLVRDGYYFKGWEPEIPEFVPEEDTVYRAKWIENDRNHNGTLDEEEYRTVTFHHSNDTDRKRDVIVTELVDGDPTPAVPDPDSWYGTEYYVRTWQPKLSDKVDGDIVYTAYDFPDVNQNGTPDEEESFTVTYIDGVEDEEIFPDVVYEHIPYGNQIPAFAEDEPKRAGWLFVRWDIVESEPTWVNYPSLDENIVKRDMVLRAVWSQNDKNGNGIADEREYCTVSYYMYEYELEQGYMPWETYSELLPGADTPVFTQEAEWKAHGNNGYTFNGWNPEWSATVNGSVNYVAVWTWNAEMDITVQTFDLYQDLIDPDAVEAAFVPYVKVYVSGSYFEGKATAVAQQISDQYGEIITCKFVSGNTTDTTVGEHAFQYRFGNQTLEYTVTVKEPLIQSVSIDDFYVFAEHLTGEKSVKYYHLAPHVITVRTTDNQTVTENPNNLKAWFYDQYGFPVSYSDEFINYVSYTGPDDISGDAPTEDIENCIGEYTNVYRVGYSEAGRAEYTATILNMITSLTAKDIKFFYKDGYAVQFPWAPETIYPFYITVETFDGKVFEGHPDDVQEAIMADTDYISGLGESQSLLQIYGDFAGEGNIWEPKVYDASFKLSRIHEGHFKVYVLPEGDINNDGVVNDEDTEEQMTLLTNDPDSSDVPCDVSRDCSTNATDLLAYLRDYNNENTASVNAKRLAAMKERTDAGNEYGLMAMKGTGSPAITIGEVEAKAGETASIPVTIISSNAIGAIGLTLDYDHAKMSLTDVVFGDVFKTGSQKANLESGRLIWADTNGVTPASGEIFATLYFQVNTDVELNEDLSVKATYDKEGDIAGPNCEVLLPELSAGTVTVTEIPEASEPSFQKHSLVLSGQIGVNFFLDLPEIEGVDYSNSYVEFTISGKDGATTIDTYDPNDKNPSGEYYGFTCYVNSIQMAETITAVFHYGEGETVTVTDTYSVKEYVEAFEQRVEENPTAFNEKMVEIIKAMADYGHYVQPFLSETRGWVIGDDYAEMDKYYTEAETYNFSEVLSAVDTYKIQRDHEDPDIEKITHALSLDSGTDIFVYFKPVSDYTGTITATVDGQAATVIEEAGRYRVAVTGISAHKLGDTHTVIATTANGSATVVVSALSYVQGILENSTDEKARNAVAAIYYYYKAAHEYIEQ